MPLVTLKTGFHAPDGREEVLSEYLCDMPGCANVATHAIACIKELGQSLITCQEHADTRRSSNTENGRSGDL